MIKWKYDSIDKNEKRISIFQKKESTCDCQIIERNDVLTEQAC